MNLFIVIKNHKNTLNSLDYQLLNKDFLRNTILLRMRPDMTGTDPINNLQIISSI
jgi:hypothetical protein